MSIFTTIGNFFKKEVPVVESAFASATSLVNVFKAFMGSATGQTVTAIVEALLPGVGTVVIADINAFFIGFGLVTNELSKAPADIAADGLNAIGQLTGNNKIIALSNLASVVGHSASNANGGNSTIQQAIVALPLVYNPNALNTVGSEVVNAPAIPQAPLSIATDADPNV